MKVIENNSSYKLEDILKIAKRDGNKKRKYLFVNPIQAKHIPTDAGNTIKMFECLASIVYRKYANEKVAVIGFAETATAISAFIASAFEDDTYYIHTTRQNIDSIQNIAPFDEEHSHAVNQNLFCSDLSRLLKVDRIIFVDDEISTGKTILNLIKSLKDNTGIDSKFAVASLLNSMSQQNYTLFKSMDIDCSYLIRMELDEIKFSNLSYEYIQNQNIFKPNVNLYSLSGKLNPRIGVEIGDYKKNCQNYVDSIISNYSLDKLKNKKILVLGTEEFMYPSILLADSISKLDVTSVKVHATTRSPIEVYTQRDYPLKIRFKFKSFYCDNTDVFVYNFENYDRILILTDTENELCLKAGIESLVSQICKYGFGNTNIDIVRWVE